MSDKLLSLSSVETCPTSKGIATKKNQDPFGPWAWVETCPTSKGIATPWAWFLII